MLSWFTYVGIEFVPCAIKTEDQGAIVIRFRNDFMIPLSRREKRGRLDALSATVKVISQSGRCGGH